MAEKAAKKEKVLVLCIHGNSSAGWLKITHPHIPKTYGKLYIEAKVSKPSGEAPRLAKKFILLSYQLDHCV